MQPNLDDAHAGRGTAGDGVSLRRINAAVRGTQRASGERQIIGSTRRWRQYLEACFAMPGQGRLRISCPCCRSAPRRRRSGPSIRCRSRCTVIAIDHMLRVYQQPQKPQLAFDGRESDARQARSLIARTISCRQAQPGSPCALVQSS